MAERIASGEIHIEVDDSAVRRDLEKIEREFESTMARIDREEATVELRATEDKLKEDLAEAKKNVQAYDKFVKESQNKRQRSARQNHLKRLKQTEDERRAALDAHQKIMRAKDAEEKAEARNEARSAARFKAQQQRDRAIEAAAKRRVQQQRQEERASAQLTKQMERENAAKNRAGVIAAKLERDNAKLNRRYNELAASVREFNKEMGSIRTPRAVHQRLELKHREALAEMRLIQEELAAMGRKPIDQEINLHVDEHGIDTLARWSRAITETTVRVGPLTTTIAGLGRGMLLLGPIISGLAGQLAALVAVTGAGLVGALGAAAGGAAAFGVALGGVGFLLPSLLKDFKNLNTMQNAYHLAVLKGGRNSSKAQQRLEEFNHALGAVEPTTRKAFLSLDRLQTKWHNLSREARPTFFNMLGESITTVNANFELFRKNSLASFEALNAGWGRWMRGLRGGEAQKILAALGENGRRSIEPLMKGLGSLATAFGRVATAFSYFLPDLLRGFAQWSQGVADSTRDANRLNVVARNTIDSMRAIGHLAKSVGRVLVAFFAPGVDDGTAMIERWSDGLDRLADSMMGAGRQGLDDWFRNSIQLANQFWSALKPLAEIFFEWTTIMRPFTVIALDVLRVLADMVQTLSDFGPTRAVLVSAFGIFLAGTLLNRVVKVGEGLWGIAKAIAAIKAAGGMGNLLKGGVLKFVTGGLAGRGTTPGNPLFTKEVGLPGGARPPGGGAPAPGGGPRIPGGGNVLKWAGRAGGLGAVAAGVVALTKAADKAEVSRGMNQLDGKIGRLVKNRDMEGLRKLKKHFDDFGGNGDKFAREVDKGIDALNKLDNEDLHRVAGSIDEDYNRLQRSTKVTFTRVSDLADYHFDLIETTMTQGSYGAQQAASKNFNRAERAIKTAMKNGSIDTDKGLALIEKLWERALSQYGFTPKQARNIKKNGNPWGGPSGKGGQGAQRGALIQVGKKGQAGPDNVPMNLGGVPSVVAPGEQIAVFNRHQQAKFGGVFPGGLEGFFSGHQRPHQYAGGGMVAAANQLEAAHFPYKWGGGHQGSPAPFGPMDCSGAVSYVLQHGGINIPTMTSSGLMNVGKPGPGEVTVFANPEHTFMRIGNRYFGTSQTNPGGGAGWFPAPSPGYLARFTQRHFDAGDVGGFADSITAPAIEGLGGKIQDIANAALQTATDAANASLASIQTTSIGAGDSQLPADAATRAQMVGWARTALTATKNLGHGGPTAGNIEKILTLAMKESSWIVRSLNNWDINAQRGNPSGGLMHVTLDKVGGSMARLFNPVENMIASIRYQMQKYHSLITFSPYAMGGLVDTMGSKEWARGGKIERPTLMTGEDKGKFPEYVISTNPMFKSSNLQNLSAAASALGIPTARKGKKKREPAKRVAIRAGAPVDKLGAVQRYSFLQGAEDDTQRMISIATSKVIEPDTFIRQVGTDPEGNALYDVDESKISKYEQQMIAVRNLWDRLVGKGGIMDQLAAAADAAYAQIHRYIKDRQANIGVLNDVIQRERRLSRSKDDDTASRAEKRLSRATDMRDKEKQMIEDARTKRGEIETDQHDAGFRRQEYGVSRAEVQRDIEGVRGRAESEKEGANPPPPGPPEPPPAPEAPEPTPTLFEQIATLSEARQELFRQFGSNYSPLSVTAPTIGGRPFGPLGMPNYSFPTAGSAAAVQSSNSAIGASRSGGGGASTYSGGGVANTPGVGGAGVAAAGGGGLGNVVNVTNNFAAPPPDPHSWSRAVSYELQAAV